MPAASLKFVTHITHGARVSAIEKPETGPERPVSGFIPIKSIWVHYCFTLKMFICSTQFLQQVTPEAMLGVA